MRVDRDESEPHARALPHGEGPMHVQGGLARAIVASGDLARMARAIVCIADPPWAAYTLW